MEGIMSKVIFSAHVNVTMGASTNLMGSVWVSEDACNNNSKMVI
jgi:hypothetical protein